MTHSTLKPGDRLPWRKNEGSSPDKPSFIAWPEGEDKATYAAVRYSVTSPKWSCWHWAINWPGRFSAGGSAETKQAAADTATTFYWNNMALTDDWTLPAEPLHPPIIAALSGMTDDEFMEIHRRYFTRESGRRNDQAAGQGGLSGGLQRAGPALATEGQSGRLRRHCQWPLGPEDGQTNCQMRDSQRNQR
jgi:hypothetical protein